MSRICPIAHATWTDAAAPDLTHTTTAALERGAVLFFPHLPFVVGPENREIFSPEILSSSKNSSFNPATGHVGGTTLEGDRLNRLRDVMTRFSDSALALLGQLLPAYRGRVERARASFRPAEIAGRHTSWRKDDTRLHVDSFPATPVQGRRILRLFSNVNPSDRPRTWRVGGDFEAVAFRFAGQLAMPLPGTGAVRTWLRLTKTRRTAYDALMLQLHDRMKADATFQATCEQESFEFPAGTTWMAFTDEVPHAAMAGQYQFEQTFLLPVDAMNDPSRSPLRILERLKGRPLL